MEDIDERADAGTGMVGSCISPTLGMELPGIINTFSSRAIEVGAVVPASLLEVALSPETLDELPASLASG